MWAIGAEARRAFRMTFVDGLAAMRLGRRSHAGWWADRYRRNSPFAGFPIFLVAAFVMFKQGSESHTFSAFFLVTLPAAILCSHFWFAVAAWSRAKSET